MKKFLEIFSILFVCTAALLGCEKHVHTYEKAVMQTTIINIWLILYFTLLRRNGQYRQHYQQKYVYKLSHSLYKRIKLLLIAKRNKKSIKENKVIRIR